MKRSLCCKYIIKLFEYIIIYYLYTLHYINKIRSFLILISSVCYRNSITWINFYFDRKKIISFLIKELSILKK